MPVLVCGKGHRRNSITQHNSAGANIYAYKELKSTLDMIVCAYSEQNMKSDYIPTEAMETLVADARAAGADLQVQHLRVDLDFDLDLRTLALRHAVQESVRREFVEREADAEPLPLVGACAGAERLRFSRRLGDFGERSADMPFQSGHATPSQRGASMLRRERMLTGALWRRNDSGHAPRVSPSISQRARPSPGTGG